MFFFLCQDYFFSIEAVESVVVLVLSPAIVVVDVVVTAALTEVVSAAGVASVAAGLLLQAVRTTIAVATKAKNTFFISFVLVLG
jgi:hypothetical protein